MNETLLWLVYLLSAAASFAGVRYRRWRVPIAVLAGTLITAIGWILLFVLTAAEKRPDWVRLDLSLNLSFGLFFAIAGAVLGRFVWLRRRGPD